MEPAKAEVVLIVGSFPPLPSPAAAATVAAVRRELESGRHVVTASPRPSAASGVVRATGPFGAWRLEQARRSSAAATLILSVEPGWPLPPATFVVLRRFAAVTLLVFEPTPAVRRAVRRLRHVTDEIVLAGPPIRSEDVAAVALAVPGVPLRVVDVAPLGPLVVGATPLGPSSDPDLLMGAACKRGLIFVKHVARRAAPRAASRVRTMTTRGP